MSITTKVSFAIATLVTMLDLVYLSNSTQAQGPNAQQKAVTDIAAAIQANNMAGAQKMAAAAIKNFEEVGDLMHLYRPATKGGLGIEKQLQVLAKAMNPNYKDAADVAPLAAAMAELTLLKPPAKNAMIWGNFAQQMRQASKDLGIAAVQQKAQDVNAAAKALNNACLGCHSKFKE